MPAILDAVLATLAGRPLLLTLAFMATASLALHPRPRQSPSAGFAGRAAARIVIGAGALAVAVYALVVAVYASDPHYYDYAEPTIAAVAWQFEAGGPLYHRLEAPERYAHIYGPMAFILHGWTLRWLGPTLVASKWLGAAAGILSLLATFAAMRGAVGARRAAALTGIGALVYLLFRNYTFWTRPEPLQLAAVSVAVWAVAAGRGFAAGALVGLSAGVLWNLKITGPLYSLPVFTLLLLRHGIRPTVVAASGAVIVAALPFLVFANVSFAHYCEWIRLSAGNGLLLSTLGQNIEWALYLLVPVLLSHAARPAAARGRDRRWRLVVIALALGMCGVVVAASKPGAAAYHLLPFVPIVLYVTAVHLRDVSIDDLPERAVAAGTIGFVAAACVIALAQQTTFLRAMSARWPVDEAADVAAFADAHPDATIEMGYGGGDERLTLARPLLVFRHGAYLIDAPAVREHQLAGLVVPASTREMLRACRVRYWLIPKGAVPFSAPNSYPALRLAPLFPDAFTRAFFAAYRRDGSTRYYDVWTCQGQARQ